MLAGELPLGERAHFGTQLLLFPAIDQRRHGRTHMVVLRVYSVSIAQDCPTPCWNELDELEQPSTRAKWWSILRMVSLPVGNRPVQLFPVPN
jgi:hypothetical protein